MQYTLNKSKIFKGIGVHSGQDVQMSIEPAGSDKGIVFIRTDLENQEIKANYRNVISTKLCTTIGEHGVSVAMVEHLMSALFGLDVDNAIIKINGPEVPILDGSAKPYVAAIAPSDIISLPGTERRVVKVLRAVTYKDGDSYVTLEPCDIFKTTLNLRYDHPMINADKYEFAAGDDNYVTQIAPARTFGFVEDVEYLRSIGLAQGASTQNAVALTKDGGILNEDGLRFDDEFVRHKTLDCLGDLYLGGRIIAHVTGQKVGHTLNNKVLHELFSDTNNYTIKPL